MRTIFVHHIGSFTALMLAAMAALLTGCGASTFANDPTGGSGGGSTGGSLPVGVPISIPAAAPGISGTVTNSLSGSRVAGVQVRAGGVSTTTNASGAYTLAGVPPATSVVITFDLAGYAPQARTTEAFTSASAAVLVNVPMVAVTSTQTFDPAAAQTLTVPGSSASVMLPANALQTLAGGAPAPGNVTALITPVGAGTNAALMPGNYKGLPAAGGPAAPVESFGGLDVRFTDASGTALNLAPSMSATLRIPVSSHGSPTAAAPLFHFDAATGLWNEMGTATLVSGQYYEGTVLHLGTWGSGQFYPATATYNGCVRDAAGLPVAGATVSWEGVAYTSAPSSVTDASGNFMLPLSAGQSAIIQAVKDIRISNSTSQTAVGGGSSYTNPTCLVLAGSVAIRLTWGAAPTDLDSHTLVSGPTNHVYWGFRNTLSSPPYVALDVDDVTSNGPEVTTVSRLAQNTTYRFYVHNFSGTFSPGMTGSPAKVELLIAGTPRVFTPPSGEGASTYWHVFDLTSGPNCNLSLTSVQQFRGTAPANPNSAATPTYCP